jgi:hypothetical protein
MDSSSCKIKRAGSMHQQNIRDTIHLLLSLLRECGMPKVSCECFRRAKYNRAEAAEELWKLTFHVMQALLILDGDMCDGNLNTIVYYPITAANAPKVKTILRHYMLELGYERKGFFMPTVGSQELLLAFAWLLHNSSFFSKLSTHFLKIASATEIPMKSASRHLVENVLEENRVMGCEVESIIAPFKPDETAMQMDGCIEALHKLVWLKGRLDAKFKSIQGLCSAYHSMTEKVHKSTSSPINPGKGHLSTHEVFLLRYPTHMKHYLAKLKKCVSVLQRVVRWQDCEGLFWQWMESILDAQEVEEKEKQSSTQATEDDNVEVTERCDVATLTITVQKRLEEFEGLLARSKQRIDRVEYVWSHRSKTLCHSDVYGKLHQLRNQLQFEYPISVKPTSQTTPASSTVELIKPIDCPTYTPAQNPQHDIQADTKHAVGEKLEAIQDEVTMLEEALKKKRTEIKVAIEGLEKWLPVSVCKIESNVYQ